MGDVQPTHTTSITAQHTQQKINSQTTNKISKNSIHEKLLATRKLPNKKNSNSNVDTQNHNSLINSQVTVDKNTPQVKSFAETTASNTHSKTNQAIGLTTVDGIKQIEYLTAISKFTAPSIIISASRISNNRFCIFLNNQSNADNLVKNAPKLYINDKEISVRKLLNPSKRIVLSNVYPIIPNESIINSLQGIGIRTTSNIFSIKSVFFSDVFHT